MKINDFKLERFFAKYEFNAPYLLCSSDCESMSVEELLALEKGSEKDLRQLRLGYTESLGSPELRSEISGLYQKAKPEKILTFAGAEEGIFIFMNTALERGDHVIVQYPAYQALYEIAGSVGCDVTKWQTQERNGWELDIDFLRKNIKKNTKAVVINTPHNPTGYLMPKEKFDQVISIAREHNLHLFCDEVYRGLEYESKTQLPAMADSYERGVSLNVMSKAFGLAGLRIGWIATQDQDLLRKMASYKDYTSICNSAPSEFFTQIALKHREEILARNRGIVQHNLKSLDEFFKQYSDFFEWNRPRAGSIAFPRIKFDQNVEDFCIDLVNKKGVLLMPSTKYDFGDKHFRVGFGRRNMPEALAHLEEYVKENLAK